MTFYSTSTIAISTSQLLRLAFRHFLTLPYILSQHGVHSEMNPIGQVEQPQVHYGRSEIDSDSGR